MSGNHRILYIHVSERAETYFPQYFGFGWLIQRRDYFVLGGRIHFLAYCEAWQILARICQLTTNRHESLSSTQRKGGWKKHLHCIIHPLLDSWVYHWTGSTGFIQGAVQHVKKINILRIDAYIYICIYINFFQGSFSVVHWNPQRFFCQAAFHQGGPWDSWGEGINRRNCFLLWHQAEALF